MASEYTLKTSGRLTADGVICARPCRIHAVTANGASLTAQVYDNATAASGTVAVEVTTGTGGGMGLFMTEVGVECLNGAYLDITGTGSFVVHYSLLS